jgi:hypothetical protein
MDMGKSFSWLLFLAVVAGVGSLGHHREADAPRPAHGPSVQMAAPAPKPERPLPAAAMTSTIAMDTTHVTVTRTAAHVAK